MNLFKTLVFDLETKRLADEVGGWDHIDKMGLSAGVTYHVEEEGWSLFKEDDAGALLDELASASKVVGFNLIRFDYTVLRPYGLSIDRSLVEKTTDMLADISLTLGFRLTALPRLNGTRKARLTRFWRIANRMFGLRTVCGDTVAITATFSGGIAAAAKRRFQCPGKNLPGRPYIDLLPISSAISLPSDVSERHAIASCPRSADKVKANAAAIPGWERTIR